MRVISVLTSAGLAAIGLLHGAWAAGLNWPGKDRAGLARIVLGSESELPAVAVAAMAALIVAAALVLLAKEFTAFRSPLPRLAVTAGPWVIAAALLARALQGFGQHIMGYSAAVTTEYRTPNVLIYSPLCAVLGVGAALIAWRGGQRLRRPA